MSPYMLSSHKDSRLLEWCRQESRAWPGTRISERLQDHPLLAKEITATPARRPLTWSQTIL